MEGNGQAGNKRVRCYGTARLVGHRVITKGNRRTELQGRGEARWGNEKARRKGKSKGKGRKVGSGDYETTKLHDGNTFYQGHGMGQMGTEQPSDT